MNNRIIARFRFGWAIFAMILYGTTWRLGTGYSDFPKIPLLEMTIPIWADFIAYGLAISAFLAVALVSLVRRQGSDDFSGIFSTAILINIAAVAWLFFSNQHRLQPWAWLAWLAAVAMIIPDQRRCLGWLRGLAISVYIYSAFTKFDYQFLHTLGQQFLGVFRDWLSLPLDDFDLNTRVLLAAVFPVVELVVGVGLIFQSTRRQAVVLALLMHACLIFLLSPLGLSHKSAVAIWNTYFIWQAIVLFWPRADTDEATGENAISVSTTVAFFATIPKLLLLAAIFLPLTQSVGFFDHWPSWGLYAPSNDRVDVFVDAEGVIDLPESLQSCCTQLAFNDPEFNIIMNRVRIDLWSLRELGVPIYPQQRFQMGVALDISRQLGHANGIVRVVLQSKSNRLDGSRTQQRIDRIKAIRKAAASYRLNANPR